MQKKILILIDESIPGGGQQHVLLLARGLPRKQFDVAVGSAAAGFLVDELRRSGIRHMPIDMPKSPAVRGVLGVKRAVQDFQPALIHTHGGIAGFYGRWAARSFPSARVVHTYHGIHYLHFPNALKRRIYAAVDTVLLRKTDWTVCVSESDHQRALTHGLVHSGSSSVIHNGIDVKRFSSIKRTTTRRRFVIGTVGRLHHQKGQVHLLHAAQQVLRKMPETEFRIVGDGDLRQDLERTARELGIVEKVTFVGASLDVPREMGMMDMFVLPSLWEGLPLVVLEAMAAGLPVVATNVDGVNEIITDGENGSIVPVGDDDSLARAVLNLMGNKKLRTQFIRRGKKTVEQHFSVEDMVSHTVAVYKKLLINV